MSTTTIKERPILFIGPMVRAILEGRKTQTRRVVEPQPEQFVESALVRPRRRPAPYIDAYNGGPTWCWWTSDDRQGPGNFKCPYGVPGDRLWVREKWRPWTDGMCTRIEYAADGALSVDVTERMCHSAAVRNGDPAHGIYWRPSIHLPRWACRLVLEVVDVRVERLQCISDADARAEGVRGRMGTDQYEAVPAVDVFQELWESINGRGSWAVNPWVWAITFKRVEGA